MPKAKPIKDLNKDQWNRINYWIGQVMLNPLNFGLLGVSEGSEDVDREIAMLALDATMGVELPDDDNGYPQWKSPPRGYTDELVDGVKSIVPVRRRQLA